MTAGAHDDAVLEEPSAYEGELELRSGDTILTAHARLSGFFQPIDGAFHWTGRTRPDAAVSDLAAEVGRKQIEVRVPGEAWVPGTFAEQNPWGGHRIAGRGHPPFSL